jgi:hypothetical protein
MEEGDAEALLAAEEEVAVLMVTLSQVVESQLPSPRT